MSDNNSRALTVTNTPVNEMNEYKYITNDLNVMINKLVAYGYPLDPLKLGSIAYSGGRLTEIIIPQEDYFSLVNKLSTLTHDYYNKIIKTVNNTNVLSIEDIKDMNMRLEYVIHVLSSVYESLNTMYLHASKLYYERINSYTPNLNIYRKSGNMLPFPMFYEQVHYMNSSESLSVDNRDGLSMFIDYTKVKVILTHNDVIKRNGLLFDYPDHDNEQGVFKIGYQEDKIGPNYHFRLRKINKGQGIQKLSDLDTENIPVLEYSYKGVVYARFQLKIGHKEPNTDNYVEKEDDFFYMVGTNHNLLGSVGVTFSNTSFAKGYSNWQVSMGVAGKIDDVMNRHFIDRVSYTSEHNKSALSSKVLSIYDLYSELRTSDQGIFSYYDQGDALYNSKYRFSITIEIELRRHENIAYNVVEYFEPCPISRDGKPHSKYAAAGGTTYVRVTTLYTRGEPLNYLVSHLTIDEGNNPLQRKTYSGYEISHDTYSSGWGIRFEQFNSRDKFLYRDPYHDFELVMKTLDLAGDIEDCLRYRTQFLTQRVHNNNRIQYVEPPLLNLYPSLMYEDLSLNHASLNILPYSNPNTNTHNIINKSQFKQLNSTYYISTVPITLLFKTDVLPLAKLLTATSTNDLSSTLSLGTLDLMTNFNSLNKDAYVTFKDNSESILNKNKVFTPNQTISSIWDPDYNSDKKLGPEVGWNWNYLPFTSLYVVVKKSVIDNLTSGRQHTLKFQDQQVKLVKSHLFAKDMTEKPIDKQFSFDLEFIVQT